MKPDPSQNVKNGSQIWCPVRTWAILISNENQQAGSHGSSHWLVLTAKPDWNPTPIFSRRVRTAQHWSKNQIKLSLAQKVVHFWVWPPPLKANVLFYRFIKNLTRFWTKLRVLVPCFLDFTKKSIMFNICENSSFLSF